MRFACFIAALLWLAPAAGAQNQVLDLDGKDSFVELPPDSFKALDEATIEAWVKWENVRGYGRLFNCGQKRSDFSIALLNGLDLWLVLVDDQSRNQELIVSAIVKPRAWCHCRRHWPRRMKLYFDGMLVATQSFTGSFRCSSRG